MTFRIGVEVTFNNKPENQFSYIAVRRRKRGTIVGKSRTDGCHIVKWTQIKRPERIHEKFLSYVDPLDELIVGDEDRRKASVAFRWRL